jgi:hypothetical protein
LYYLQINQVNKQVKLKENTLFLLLSNVLSISLLHFLSNVVSILLLDFPAHAQKEGGILVFMAGQQEVSAVLILAKMVSTVVQHNSACDYTMVIIVHTSYQDELCDCGLYERYDVTMMLMVDQEKVMGFSLLVVTVFIARKRIHQFYLLVGLVGKASVL